MSTETRPGPDPKEAIDRFLKDLDQLVSSSPDSQLSDNITEYLKQHSTDLPWHELEPNIGDRGEMGRYGRLQLGVGESTGLELVLAHVPPKSEGRIERHGHCGWAVVLVLRGTEVNELFEADSNGKMQCVSTQTFGAGEVAILAPEAIHSIYSPEGSVSLHVYDRAQAPECGAKVR